MASRYWVAPSNAAWNGTAGSKWALTSGGTGGQAVPTSSDNVFFDANSGANSITLDDATSAVCNNLDYTGFAGTQGGGGNAISISGNVTFAATTTYSSFSGSFKFVGTGAQSITSASASLAADIILNGVGATYTLQDALITTGNITHTQGTFNANNKNLTFHNYAAGATSTGAVTMGSGTWNATNAFTISAGSTVAITPNTSTIKFTGTGTVAFTGNGFTYNNFWNAKTSGGTTIIGSNTFTDFKIDDGRTVSFTGSTTQTVTTFTALGVTGITLQAVSGTWTVSATSGTIAVTGCTISNSIATGGAIWNAFTTQANVNGGGNAGWVFGFAGGLLAFF